MAHPNNNNIQLGGQIGPGLWDNNKNSSVYDPHSFQYNFNFSTVSRIILHDLETEFNDKVIDSDTSENFLSIVTDNPFLTSNVLYPTIWYMPSVISISQYFFFDDMGDIYFVSGLTPDRMKYLKYFFSENNNNLKAAIETILTIESL